MDQTAKQPLFPLGQVSTTPAVLAALGKAGQGPPEFLARHASGDWGDLCERDRQENQFSLQHGGPLFSAYHTQAGDELWVITDRQPATTTILLPHEY
jgi:hypothetical protein